MYAFAQREDTIVFDEPLYAHYLKVSGAMHPAREQALEALENDGSKVHQSFKDGYMKYYSAYCQVDK